MCLGGTPLGLQPRTSRGIVRLEGIHVTGTGDRPSGDELASYGKVEVVPGGFRRPAIVSWKASTRRGVCEDRGLTRENILCVLGYGKDLLKQRQ